MSSPPALSCIHHHLLKGAFPRLKSVVIASTLFTFCLHPFVDLDADLLPPPPDFDREREPDFILFSLPASAFFSPPSSGCSSSLTWKIWVTEDSDAGFSEIFSIGLVPPTTPIKAKPHLYSRF